MPLAIDLFLRAAAGFALMYAALAILSGQP